MAVSIESGMQGTRELTELRVAVARLRGREALLTRIDDETRGLIDPLEITMVAATLVGQHLRVNRCAFADVEEDQDTFNLTGNYVDGIASMVGRYRLTQFSQACVDELRAGRPFVVEDTETDPRVRNVLPIMRAAEVRSVIAVPLMKNGMLVATMAIHCNVIREWNADEVSLLLAVTGRCWESIERTRVLRDLQVSRNRLRLSQEAGRVGTFEWDIVENKVIWTPELEKLYGVPENTFEGRIEHWVLRVVPEDAERVLREIEDIMAEQTREYGYDFRVVMPDGERRWMYGQAYFEYDSQGKPLRMVGVNMDIHERRMAEDGMIRAEKLAAVGRLASSIAHEINNPLESVTNLMYLASHCESLDEARAYLATADGELRRVASIVNQTLRFHKQTTKPTTVRGDELFNGTLTVYKGRLLNSNVRIFYRIRAERPVHCFEGEIRQVVNNLIGNAIDAMPKGGTLYLRTHETKHGKTGVEGIVWTIADTGTGMNKTTIAKAFDAFYTTKGFGGTGLGLWVSQEIVARHRGSLQVRSREGSGTVFRLFLPFEAAPRPAKLAAAGIS